MRIMQARLNRKMNKSFRDYESARKQDKKRIPIPTSLRQLFLLYISRAKGGEVIEPYLPYHKIFPLFLFNDCDALPCRISRYLTQLDACKRTMHALSTSCGKKLSSKLAKRTLKADELLFRQQSRHQNLGCIRYIYTFPCRQPIPQSGKSKQRR